MTRDDYLGLLREALGSEFGIALRIGDLFKAVQARRKFYRLREQLRANGDAGPDCLSFAIVASGDLHIIKRNTLPKHRTDDGLSAGTRPLARNELPNHIGARGPHRSPAFANIVKHFSSRGIHHDCSKK